MMHCGAGEHTKTVAYSMLFVLYICDHFSMPRTLHFNNKNAIRVPADDACGRNGAER